MSETKGVITAIVSVMRDMEAIAKTRTNKDQGFSFRGIEDFYNSLHPLFAKYSLLTVPVGQEVTNESRVSKSGTPMVRVVTKTTWRIYGPDGSFIDAQTSGEGIDSSDKAVNKAASGAHKYLLTQLFMAATEDERDQDESSPEAGTEAAVSGTTSGTTELNATISKIYTDLLILIGKARGKVDGEKLTKLTNLAAGHKGDYHWLMDAFNRLDSEVKRQEALLSTNAKTDPAPAAKPELF